MAKRENFIITLSENGITQAIATRHKWNSARRCVPDLIRAQLTKGERAEIISEASNRPQFTRGDQQWRILDTDRVLDITIEKENME